MENIQEKPEWYVVQTTNGYEKVVQNSIMIMAENNNYQDRILDVVVPEIEEIQEKNGKKKVVITRKFPCYVFIKMIYDKEVWYMVNAIRGVVRPRNTGKPVSLTDEEVKHNQLEKMTENDFQIKVGDNVEVLSGPLTSMPGEVINVDYETQQVRVVVNLFGKDTPTDLDFISVRKIDL